MKIRYQNGQSIEAITLSRGKNALRVLLRGTEDVIELTRVNSVWVTEDCEPVTLEYPSARPPASYREEDLICSADLAAHLIHLLYTDSSEDVPEAPAAAPERELCAAARVA